MIKTYILSKIVFLATIIETPHAIVRELKDMCFTYLWNGKRDRIKRSTMIRDIQDGGLKMIDIDAFLLSLRASWVTRFLSVNGKWKDIFEEYVHQLGFIDPSYLLKMSFKDNHMFKIIDKLPLFYQEVLTAHNQCKVNIKLVMMSNYDLLTQPLWGNFHFKVNDECLYFSEWVKSNILYVKDLVNKDGCIKSDEELFKMIRNKRNLFKEIFMVKKYILQKIKTFNLSNANFVKINPQHKILYRNKYYNIKFQKSKFYYKCLLLKIHTRGNMESIWARAFNFHNCESTWINIYKQKIISVNVVKIAEFNFKVLHNIIPCGKILNKWQGHISDKCESCNQIETTEHMLYSCNKITSIWEKVSLVLKMNIKWKNIVCGLPSSENSKNVCFLNFVISIVAYSIFKHNNLFKRKKTKLNQKVEIMIMRDLLMYKEILKCKNDNIFDDVRFEILLEYMS